MSKSEMETRLDERAGQIKKLKAENEKLLETLLAAGFLGNGTQLIGDMRYRELVDKEAALDKATAENEKLRKAIKGKQEVLDSVAGCVVSQPRDFALDHRDAWMYWILFGWGDAEDEILARHKWSDTEIARLRRLREQALKEST